MKCDIKQKELKKVLLQQASLKAMRSNVRKLEQQLSDQTSKLLSRIKHGEEIEDGQLTATIEKNSRVSRISEELIKSILGPKALQKLSNNKPVKEFEELQITTK